MQVKVQLFGKAEDIERALQRIAQTAHVVSVGDAAPQCPLNRGGSCAGADPTWMYRLAVIDPDAEPDGDAEVPGSEVLTVTSEGQTIQSNQFNRTERGNPMSNLSDKAKLRLKVAAAVIANIALALFLIVFHTEFQAMAASEVDWISAAIGKAALVLTWLFAAYLAVQAVAAAVMAWKAVRKPEEAS